MTMYRKTCHRYDNRYIVIYENWGLKEGDIFLNLQIPRQKNLSSPFFSDIRVAQSLVFCVVFCSSLFVLLPFPYERGPKSCYRSQCKSNNYIPLIISLFYLLNMAWQCIEKHGYFDLLFNVSFWTSTNQRQSC
jgi:hypothetical protein